MAKLDDLTVGRFVCGTMLTVAVNLVDVRGRGLEAVKLPAAEDRRSCVRRGTSSPNFTGVTDGVWN